MSQHYRKRMGRAMRGLGEFERALLGDDGPDARKSFDPQRDRKTLQLCRQVQRALSLELAGDCGDEVLRDVYVASVQPMGGAGQLLVGVAISSGSQLNWMMVLQHLEAQGGRLRAAVARSICRKRTPMLSFTVVADGPIADDGGAR